jgi:uncharacterized protein
MIPLRLVLDTNVLVSAVVKPDGLQRTVLPGTEIRSGPRRQLLQLIKNHSRLVRVIRPLRLAKDPGDDKFLECADTARADYLVTGNQRDFPKFWKSTNYCFWEAVTVFGPSSSPSMTIFPAGRAARGVC